MKCPFCQHTENNVVDSRVTSEEESVRRRRECAGCKERFTTYERAEGYEITVLKRDGSVQPFSREKLLRGLMLACEKRPVKHEQIETVASRIETTLRRTNKDQVKSSKIGQLVMAELAQLDDVAYVRFTSVHKKFKDAQQFVDAIKNLRKLEANN
ncbi:MAG TPA: transcriptional regulator NrdR [Candidatus Nanoarchaeia archaeon]|nr:transcriptional regulator NrdR [Candidatus Nanoarchaeia archaeon]